MDILEHMDSTIIYDLDKSSQRLDIEKDILDKIDDL